MLEIKNIKAGYGKKVIIDNINFTMKPGQLTAILGLNGSGKTTLLKTMCGLIEAMEGNVLLGQKDLIPLDEKQMARNISYMPQRHSIVYDIKVIDLVLMGITPYLSIFQSPNKEHMKKAYKCLEIVNMEGYSERNFLHLSGGQQQLVVLARSLMQNSEIMLFDEPVSALDFKNKHLVLDNIKDILQKHGKFGMVSLHDPNLALSYCNKIIIIHKGRIYSKFFINEINGDNLKEIFSELYGEISIIKHKEKYVIIR